MNISVRSIIATTSFHYFLNDAGKFVLIVPLYGQTIKLLSTFDNIGAQLWKILDTLDLCILNFIAISPLVYLFVYLFIYTLFIVENQT